jgi:FBP C-terminal treble-clef zinc-finger
MKPLTESLIRESFVNATEAEIDRMPMPGLHEVIWQSREFLGWRDAQSRLRGYLVHWPKDGLADRPIGVVLRASEVGLRPGISAMCALCLTHQPSPQVRLFSAARAGQAGRDGNTIGTYICDDLACSIIIRITAPAHPMLRAPEDIIAARAAALLTRLNAFTADVMKTA